MSAPTTDSFPAVPARSASRPASEAPPVTGSFPSAAAALGAHERAGLAEVFVAPFYLSMMRLNALRAEPGLVARAARGASVLTTDDVVYLLRCGAWREQVMGAWYALSRPGDQAVRAEVLDTLATRCTGDLTSPPLATAAVVLAGRDAVGALEAFVARLTPPDHAEELLAKAASPDQLEALRGEHGRRFAAAAAEFARGHGSRSMPRPTDDDRAHLSAMLHIAARFVAPAANWELPGGSQLDG